MPLGSILYAERDGIRFIRFIGSVTYTISSGFDHLIDEIAQETETRDVVFDLNPATHIDSTNLGLMAKVARFMLKRFNRRAIILCDNPDIETILLSMGFEQAFEIVKVLSCDTPEFSDVPAVEQACDDQRRMLVEAHRTLMEMNEKNRETFRTVVEAFDMDGE